MTETQALAGGGGLERALAISPGDEVERAYVFEPLERGGASFTLLFVTRAEPDDRLEMIALGRRAQGGVAGDWDFVRRARFPRTTLSTVLEEFIERCGVDGAAYREVDLSGEGIAGLERHLAAASPSSPETVEPS